jgi:DNA-binding XRE family transcriptional regulator
MGGSSSGRRPKPGRRQRILGLRASGLKVAQIARRLEVAYQLVQYYLKTAGLRRGVVRCRACGAEVATGPRTIELNRAPVCLPCLANRPEAPFSERLKAHRLAAGLTQAELAERAGVPVGTIGPYEWREVTPGADIVARLARVLGPGLG